MPDNAFGYYRFFLTVLAIPPKDKSNSPRGADVRCIWNIGPGKRHFFCGTLLFKCVLVKSEARANVRLFSLYGRDKTHSRPQKEKIKCPRYAKTHCRLFSRGKSDAAALSALFPEDAVGKTRVKPIPATRDQTMESRQLAKIHLPSEPFCCATEGR